MTSGRLAAAPDLLRVARELAEALKQLQAAAANYSYGTFESRAFIDEAMRRATRPLAAFHALLDPEKP